MSKKDIENSIKNQKENNLNELLKQKDANIRKEQIIKKYSEFLTKDNIYKYAFKELINNVVINKDKTIEIRFNFNLSNKLIINYQ